MRRVPTELWVLLVSATEQGLFIHCLPTRDARVPDGMETLRWAVETANGTAWLKVKKVERYADRTVGLTCIGRGRGSVARLAAAMRFAEGEPFTIAAVRVEADEDAVRLTARPGWTTTGCRRYEKQDAAERAA